MCCDVVGCGEKREKAWESVGIRVRGFVRYDNSLFGVVLL